MSLVVAVFLLGCQSVEPAFPLGIYGVKTEDLATVRKAGFNLVRGPADAEFLDAAAAEGLKVLASPRTTAGPKFNARRARATVEAFDGHPALWAWYLIDEPDLHGVPPGQVRAAHRYLKSVPARKPTALVIYYGSEALHYGNIADLTMFDRYPIPWMPLAHFVQHARMTRLALGPDEPMIAVIQAFDWSYYPDLMPSEEPMRPPTREEIRCMTYGALAMRATGLFYYCFQDSKWSMRDHPETWEALRQVAAEVNERRPLFEARQLWRNHFHRFGDGDRQYNEALEASITPSLLRVRAGNAVIPAGDYIMAVNTTPEKHVYGYYAPELSDSMVPVVGENRFAPVKDYWIEDHFDPYSVRIYGPLPRLEAE